MVIGLRWHLSGYIWVYGIKTVLVLMLLVRFLLRVSQSRWIAYPATESIRPGARRAKQLVHDVHQSPIPQLLAAHRRQLSLLAMLDTPKALAIRDKGNPAPPPPVRDGDNSVPLPGMLP